MGLPRNRPGRCFPVGYVINHYPTRIGARVEWVAKEENMTRKKGKSVSFDAMVKFFIQNYNIPTKNDLDKIQVRLDQIERLLRSGSPRARATAKNKGAVKNGAVTALDTVFDIIHKAPEGSSFKDIQNKTGYDDKKIRNVIFRLNKMEKIKRKSRGIYVTS
jgi:hypothetical protein